MRFFTLFFLYGCYSESKVGPQDPNIDVDGDGYTGSEDCDDQNPLVYVGAQEICDGLDNDCDDIIDNGSLLILYADADEDGYGDESVFIESCNREEGYVENSEDCDDSNINIHPNATEVCDEIDNNCDGNIDEDSAFDAPSWYADTDNDTYGDPNSTQNSCTQPIGFVSNDEDCDDENDTINPNAIELCDDIDNNCDGTIDENINDALVWYADTDNDTFGDPNSTIESCEQPTGYVQNDEDCDDSNVNIHPFATEICDNLDNNCDDTIDDNSALDALIWYADIDNDSFGNPNSTMSSCEQPTGYISNDEDCDDLNNAINPNASEVCDEIDNNCDGTIDENSATDASTWYADSDNDTFGDPLSTMSSCEQPNGYVNNDEDCDDDFDTVNPNATEICDLFDNNCDGTTDEDLYGLGEYCAGESCDEILGEEPSSIDGVYWIDPQGTGSFEAYCDMTQNGGGWTLLLKTDGSYNTDFYYSDPKWTNNSLHNDSSMNTSIANAKFEAFISLDIQELYGCFPSQGNHCIYLDTGSFQTAQDIFSGGFINASSNFYTQMYSGWAYQNHCHLFGVNTNNGAAKARFGFSANNEGNCNSNDTAIGFGLGYNSLYAGVNFSSGNYCNYGSSCGSIIGNPLTFEGFLWGR
ncbi:MAG: hypothetical protein CL916_09705 [Deltaproteobacteria bacterium]|nr:hypothetical protein [Deltaproteobacteria bacterium]